jgi:predicted transcriptional regulator of viral defense system
VICLVSALSFHDLTDEVPHEVSIAIPRSSSAPKIMEVPVRVFRFSDASYELGIEHHNVGGIDLKVYSAERTIVDAFRFRNRIGDDVAIGALTRALRNRKVRPGKLLELAEKLRARRVLEPYLKAIT